MSSNPAPTNSIFYQLGGSLVGTAPSYVLRQADAELWNALQSGEYCYILNARQTGKSSLRARTMRRLKAEGVACAEVELNGIGSQNITAQQWYGGIIWELTSGFSLTINLRQWLREHGSLSPVQRLKVFIETVLLKQISGKIVIFFDEIDSVLGLQFPTDEFFSLIRCCYNERANQIEFCRLSFVLLGVTTPSELIQNKLSSTPFNIGRSIELQEFRLNEIMPLARGLEHLVSQPELLLQAVLSWTGGQPFLTQKLCWLVKQKLEVTPEPENYAQFVANLVQTNLIQDWESQDEPEHLRTIRDRIVLQKTPVQTRVLKIYRRICEKKSVKARQNVDHLALKLSGLVTQKSGHWVIKNKIYKTIFDLNWIQEISPEVPKILKWKSVAITLGISALSTSLIVSIRLLGFLQPWELQTFDKLMQARPFEGSDPRLILINITEADVQNQPIEQRGASSLSDATLDQLRHKLEAGKPRVIGLDIYREQAVKPEFSELDAWMRNQKNLITICSYGTPGVPGPPNVDQYNYGFNNVIEDQDGILRRFPLAVGEPSPCRSHYSFSWLIASHYLEQEGVHAGISSEGYLRLGNVAFPPLESRMGGYNQINSAGHQIMVNPRITDEVADTISLGEFLSEITESEIIRDRIVIIGTIASSFNDNHWLTSQSRKIGVSRSITGSEVQAHLVSQLLSTVLDNRPVIWSWSVPIEIIWISIWALGGGVMAAYFKNGRSFVLLIGISCLSLWGISWVILLFGGWIPLFPAGLALLVTSGSTCLALRHVTASQLERLGFKPEPF